LVREVAMGIKIVEGDITKLQVDAIVNAANPTLLGGGGVDGAIHRAAGPELLEECKQIGGCPTGEVRVTKGYKLPAKWVIHTVGPVWKGGGHNEDQLLRSCYRESLKAAQKLGIGSIAFPSISTGAYGFPFERACRIAISEALEFLKSQPELEVVFVCFGKDAYETYKRIYQEMTGKELE
jgi:O-acetyl-ADP-ribose deacetylase (regulator of RNase III)